MVCLENWPQKPCLILAHSNFQQTLRFIELIAVHILTG